MRLRRVKSERVGANVHEIIVMSLEDEPMVFKMNPNEDVHWSVLMDGFVYEITYSGGTLALRQREREAPSGVPGKG